jgi:hypothetical protein
VPVRSDTRGDLDQVGSLARPEATPSHEVGVIVALVLAGLVLAECVRDGGFWRGDALVVAIASGAVLLIVPWLAPLDRRGWAVVSGLVALATWWLVRAGSAHLLSHFLPLGAGLLGCGASFVVVRSLDPAQRALAAAFVGLVGAGVAITGLVGLVLRWKPLAIPSQHLWRLSSSLTYADAAGVVLGMGLVMALGSELRPWFSRVCVCLCAGGLLATQSRGAVLAVVCAAAFVPWRRYLHHLVPLLAGALMGAVAIATSPWHHAVPVLGVVVVGCVGCSVAWAPRLPRFSRRAAAWGAALAAVAGTVAIVGLRHEISLRTFSPSNQDRSVEWSTAWHQFTSAVLVGVGPDRTLHFHATDGTFAHFAHNEYLQIAADGGLVGLALLAMVVVSLVRLVRRDSLIASCATAGLVCLGVGAVFDFDWHLSVIGLLGGWLAGLGAPLPPTSSDRSAPDVLSMSPSSVPPRIDPSRGGWRRASPAG